MAKREIPKLALFTCPTCKNETVAAQGSRILCQDCVNTFLAKNVGLMIETEGDDDSIPLESGVVSEGTG